MAPAPTSSSTRPSWARDQGPARRASRSDNWRSAVFGYTGMIDVSARAEGRSTWRQGSWMGKSFDTFAPIGPCITTADEIGDPNQLRVRFWNNGELCHDYETDDMEHTGPRAHRVRHGIMTLYSGDLIACGTNHEGLGPLQDGEMVEIEVEKVGRMRLHVRDPLKRPGRAASTSAPTPPTRRSSVSAAKPRRAASRSRPAAGRTGSRKAGWAGPSRVRGLRGSLRPSHRAPPGAE